MGILFTVENGIVKPNPNTLLIEPFKTIWERDTTPIKSLASKEFTYIEFMSSKMKDNPYRGYDDDLRHLRLVKEFLPEGWNPDKLIEQGLIKVAEFQKEASETYSYFISVINAANKMKQFFDSFDMNAKNERTGLPIYKPKDITGAMIDTEKVLQNINAMKEKVEQELFETTKTRSNKQVNPFEV